MSVPKYSSAADCDDVLQNVGAVLWEKFDSYRPEESFARWAFGIARLEVLKYRQQQCRRVTGFRAELVDVVAKETLEVSETANLLGEALTEVRRKAAAVEPGSAQAAFRGRQECPGYRPGMQPLRNRRVQNTSEHLRHLV